MISKPYPYRHTYKVLLYKNSTLEWITYAMHCEHEVPMHHKTKKELYDRLAMGGIKSKEIKRIKAA